MCFIRHFLFSVLTPVNEYNIVDKIQTANNQLFASIDDIQTMAFQKPSTENSTNKSDKLLLQSKHRVTFSSDIEEYEDDISDEEIAGVQYKDDEAIDKEIAEIIERDENQAEENDKVDGLMKRLSIEEVYSNDDASDDYTTELEVVEEINDTVEESNINESNHLQSIVPIETININNSNVQTVKEKEKIIVPLNVTGNGTDGDKPPCRACNKVNYTSSIRQGTKRPTTSQATTGFKRSTISQTNRIVSANMPRNSMNKDSDDLLKIHLNVRACCENRYLDNNRLPRYNGYISQYGLSKDQLEQRESNRQKYLEKRARRDREITRAKQEIADLNEQAFRQWLVRKNHVARPKYKNMYDEMVSKPRIKYHPSKKFPRTNEQRSSS